MDIKLPLNEMTIAEKLKIMEQIWENLSQNHDNIISPEWHEKSLKETNEKVKKGLECSSDWTTAKKELRKIFE